MNTKKTWSLVRRRWSKYSIDSGIEKLIDISLIIKTRAGSTFKATNKLNGN